VIHLPQPLILASRSPQRRAILTQLGIPFTVVEPGYVEVDPPGERPSQLVVTQGL
jgi:predicted house-cleaning NTP pyrophosphatase (Maf/HAM1 superfamily)